MKQFEPNKSEVSKKRAKELKALAAMPDSEIDFSDAPEFHDWSGAVVGKFYRGKLLGKAKKNHKKSSD